MKTIKKRVEELEEAMPTTGEHDYLMVVGMDENGRVGCKYFKDGKPITRAMFDAEAPKEPISVNVDWSEPKQPGEAADENDKQTN